MRFIASAPALDTRELRRALGAFATGVTVITTGRGDSAYAMTANAFTSVSLEPPLILVCVRQESEAVALLAANGAFTVNILSVTQEYLSRRFSSDERPRGAATFRQVPHRVGATGAAVLTGAAGHLDCTVHALQEAGDHFIVLGEVVDFEVDGRASPLVFHSGRYERLAA